jgi:predicted lipoprotein with Yx(FWY)xxD motif
MKITAVLAVSATALLTLSACGGAASGTGAGAGAGTPRGAAHHIHTATTSLGRVLVDGNGMTLYVLSADGHDHSTCSASCLQFWPAAAPGRATGLGASAGRTATPSGTAIATVGGHPVYSFALDHQPGDVKGEGVTEFGGTWYAASPTGAPVTKGSAPSSGSSSSSARGYAY